MRVIVAAGVAGDLGAFLAPTGRPQTQIVHRDQNSTLRWFQTISRIRQRSTDDDAHRVSEITRAHLILNLSVQYLRIEWRQHLRLRFVSGQPGYPFYSSTMSARIRRLLIPTIMRIAIAERARIGASATSLSEPNASQLPEITYNQKCRCRNLSRSRPDSQFTGRSGWCQKPNLTLIRKSAYNPEGFLRSPALHRYFLPVSVHPLVHFPLSFSNPSPDLLIPEFRSDPRQLSRTFRSSLTLPARPCNSTGRPPLCTGVIS